MKEEWGEWQYAGMPSLGAYIQVEGLWLSPPYEKKTFEGIVVGVKGTIVTLSPIPEDTGHWQALKWRERVLPEFNKSVMRDEILA